MTVVRTRTLGTLPVSALGVGCPGMSHVYGPLTSRSRASTSSPLSGSPQTTAPPGTSSIGR